jgi:hypothetical protein
MEYIIIIIISIIIIIIYRSSGCSKSYLLLVRY